ncbi:MAG: electron transport protein SCO1/SenC [Pseudomonadota bacterium]
MRVAGRVVGPAQGRGAPGRRLVLAALAAAAWGLAGCDRLGLGGEKAPPFHGIDITGANYANELALPDPEGRPRTLAEFKGRVLVVFFGFTQCPDVCPTTLGELAAAKRALGADGARVQGIFVTVDPARDTPEVLRAYVAAFDPSFVALRGTDEQTRATAKAFKVYFNKVEGRTPETYTIDHTAGAYVFDAKGRVRLFTRHGGSTEALVSDLKRLLAEG